MQDIKVKVYGIIDLTRNQYLMIQFIGLIILLLLLAAYFYFDLGLSEEFIFRHIDTFCYTIIVLEIVETFFVLKKFQQKKQALQQE
ncbi:hypothetical protein [Kaarinaea lacus]